MNHSIKTCFFLFFVIFSLPAFAGKAIVLPEGVFNFNVIYKYSYADSGYDENGNRISLPNWTYDIAAQKLREAGAGSYVPFITPTDKAKTDIHKLDFSIAYGITNHISFLGLVPTFYGYRRDSSLQSSLPGKDVEIATSHKEFPSELGDISFGFQHQAYGSNQTPFRFTYSAGFRAPTGHVADPLSPTDDSTGSGQWVAILWLDFDYEWSRFFYLNLHTEHEYQFKGKKKAKPFGVDAQYDIEFQPGIKNTIELEPHFTYPVSKVKLFLDIPLTWSYQGKMKMQDFDTLQNQYAGALKEQSRTNVMTLYIMPTIGVELFELMLPFRIYAGYQIPLAGKNINAVYTLSFRIETYWKF